MKHAHIRMLGERHELHFTLHHCNTIFAFELHHLQGYDLVERLECGQSDDRRSSETYSKGCQFGTNLATGEQTWAPRTNSFA